jgi:Tfp pilus assembly protein PilE
MAASTSYCFHNISANLGRSTRLFTINGPTVISMTVSTLNPTVGYTILRAIRQIWYSGRATSVVIPAASTFPGGNPVALQIYAPDAAMKALMDLANQMQRYYSENNTYPTAKIANVGANSTSTQGFYTLSIPPATLTANSYTIKATRAGLQTADIRCGDLALTSTNVRDIVGGTAGITAADCW